MEALAARKFGSFKEYFALYPEYTSVFIGDNGQGDVRCGEMMLTDKTCSGSIERLYFHQIQPLHLTYATNESTKTKQGKNSKIYYFRNYVDAAIDAHHHKLILSKGLLRIMQEAVDDFNYIPQSSWSLKPTPKPAPVAPAAITNVDSGVSPVKAPAPEKGDAAADSSRNGTNGGSTKTSTTAKAVSAVSNAATKISTTIIKSTPLPKQQPKKSSVARQLPIVNNLATMESQYWEVRRELRIRELNRDIERGNAILHPLGLGPAPYIEYPERFQVGAQIKTLFGLGTIAGYRTSDGIYEVEVPWSSGASKGCMKVFLPGIAINVKS